MQRLSAALSRRKTTSDGVEDSKLARVLSLLDLTALGVGSTLGLGVYVLAGAVAKNEAGPAVCLSFLVAAISSAFAGVCYAEFAARVPKAGSAYVYSYVSIGEFVAFIIGWNLILEYVIGTASVARGLSGYIDTLTNNTMKEAMLSSMPIHVDFLAAYPDFFSLGIVILLAVLLSVGVKESTALNNVFTALNLITVAIALVAGSCKADVKNWKLDPKDAPKGANVGSGGFLPFGFGGVMAGAAKCFYGFVGFDCVATTGEEAKNPQRNIPLAIVISLIIIFLAYFGISTVLTMMWPYYDQNPEAPFPYAFEKVGWPAIKWIVSIGAIFALCTSLLGSMFPLPRILYSMACDGLIFRSLAKVHPKTRTPLKATLLSGLLAGAMATVFNLEQLIDMMSIGTLLAYTIVAICVLVLRYKEDAPICSKDLQSDVKKSRKGLVRTSAEICNLNGIKDPTDTSSTIVIWAVVLFSFFAVIFCAVVIYSGSHMIEGENISITIFAASVIGLVVTLLVIARQPSSSLKLSFKVPCVPVIPCASVVINLYLMMELDRHTWIRFSAWMVIGLAIYFFYGIHNSSERSSAKADADAKLASSVHNDTLASMKPAKRRTKLDDYPSEGKFHQICRI